MKDEYRASFRTGKTSQEMSPVQILLPIIIIGVVLLAVRNFGGQNHATAFANISLLLLVALVILPILWLLRYLNRSRDGYPQPRGAEARVWFPSHWSLWFALCLYLFGWVVIVLLITLY